MVFQGTSTFPPRQEGGCAQSHQLGKVLSLEEARTWDDFPAGLWVNWQGGHCPWLPLPPAASSSRHRGRHGWLFKKLLPVLKNKQKTQHVTWATEPIFMLTLWGLPEPPGPRRVSPGPGRRTSGLPEGASAGKASSCWSKLSPRRHSVRSLPTPLYTPTAQGEAADAQTWHPRAQGTKDLPADHTGALTPSDPTWDVHLQSPQLEETACRWNPIYVKTTYECTGLIFLCMAGFLIIFTLLCFS